jgi:Tol biopolymer transport system component
MSTVAISPDGRWLAFVGAGEAQQIYLDDLQDPEEAREIRGTEGSAGPFFSPDGTWLAFGSETHLRVVSTAGGEPRTLAPTSMLGGGTWTPEGDTIYYSPGVDAGLWKIAVEGGTAVEVTRPQYDGFDNNHRFPEMLPGGRRLLYTSAYGRHRLMVLDLESNEAIPILENEPAFSSRYVKSGHLLYAQASGALMAVRFDPETLEVGSPVEVVQGVVVGNELAADYSVSETGTLVYAEGVSGFRRRLMRVTRDGSRRTLNSGGPAPYSLRMSFDPTGERLAFTLFDGQQDIYLYDLVRDDQQPLVTDPHNDFDPLWSRSGERIAFTSARSGILDLYVAPVDRAGVGTPLITSQDPKWASSWSPGDSLLAFVLVRPESRHDIWIYSVENDSAWAFRDSPEIESFPSFSPDGAWIAYEKGGPTDRDVYVAPFPGPGPECKVSTNGGWAPRWSSDGNEIFFRSDDRAMVANVGGGDYCRPVLTELFRGLEGVQWTPHPDGEFFIAVEPRPEPRLRMIQDFFEVLGEKAPGKTGSHPPDAPPP